MELFTQENTYRGALKFFKRKTLQLNIEGFNLLEISEFSNIGVLCTYIKNGIKYHIFYLYKNLRGRGYYEKIAKKHKWNVIVSDSKYYSFFKEKKISYIPLSGINKLKDYELACEKLKKIYDSNEIPLIYKLDVRLLILRSIGGSFRTLSAMCKESYLDHNLDKYGQTGTIELVKSYRNIKRSYYLADIYQNNEHIIRPFNKEVRKMVAAFKVEEKILKEVVFRDNSYRSNRWMGILSVSSEFIKDQKRKLDYLKY